MPRYAVKIGEIHIRSEWPISETERQSVLRQLHENPELTYTEEGLEIVTQFSPPQP